MTGREQTILETLTHKVHLMAARQAARAWWSAAPPGVRSAEAALRALADGGWLRRLPVKAEPELPLEAPLFIWRPDEPAPNFGALAHRVRSRWQQPAVQAVVYLATPRAAAALGGVVPSVKPQNVTHDLHVTTLYLRRLMTAPADAGAWVLEDFLAEERTDQVLPDAILRDAGGRDRCAVEFAGKYPAERLRRFHADCVARDLPYELW